MRGSEKNVRRLERRLEEVISELVAQDARSADRKEVLKEYLPVIKGIAEATRELANAAVVSAECSKAGRRKYYEARYYVSSRGINGNLVRSWDINGSAEGEPEGQCPSPPQLSVAINNFVSEIWLCLRLATTSRYLAASILLSTGQGR